MLLPRRELLSKLIPVLERMEADRKKEQEIVEAETNVSWEDDERSKDYIYIDSTTGKKVQS